MKTLACKDFDIECDFVAKGTTDKKVMNIAADHVRIRHPQKWNEIKNMKPAGQAKMMIPKIKEM